MPLFLIQDPDRPAYVFARSFAEAHAKWKRVVSAENDGDAGEPPQGIQFIADDSEIILDDVWESAK
jgi:hypothetical protein